MQLRAMIFYEEAMSVELRVLQYFLAVAREQSISAAAESLHLSQPTLSTQLKNMEDELGKRLMIRGTKGSRKIILTEEGMILRKRAEEILDLVNKTKSEVSLSEEAVTGEIYIGTGETDMMRMVAKAAQELQNDYPEIHYHILSGNAIYVLEQLDKGLIDFGLVFGPVDSMKYDSLKISVRDIWGVLMRKDSPLARKKAVEPEDLWDKPLIISNQKSDDWPMSSWMKQDIGKLHVVATYNLVFNASLLVDEGLGYAICLDHLINTTGESNLCFRPLFPKLESGASIIWKKYQVFSKAAAKLLTILKKHL